MRHPRADLLDDPCTFVAEDHRPAAAAQRTLSKMEVGVADARRRDTYEHLFVSRRIELDLLDVDRPPRLVQNDRANPHATR
jgi:hypothetical protein